MPVVFKKKILFWPFFNKLFFAFTLLLRAARKESSFDKWALLPIKVLFCRVPSNLYAERFRTLHEYFMMQNRPNLFPTNNLTKFCKHQGQISNVCLQFWVAKFKYLLADKKILNVHFFAWFTYIL